MTPARRRELVDRRYGRLSVVRQCQLLGVSRSSFYYRAQGTSPQDLTPDAGAGPPVPGDALLRFQADESLSGEAGQAGQQKAGAAAHETDGAAGHLPAASHQPAGAGATGLSLPAAGVPASPGPTRCGRRTSPTCPWPEDSCTWWRSWTGTAGTCWPGDCPTPWRSGFCAEALTEALGLWQARGVQHGPGKPVHQPGVHADTAGSLGEDQHGRPGQIPGQHLRGGGYGGR